MKKLLQNLEENLPVYIMLLMLFAVAVQYVSWNENIICHLIDGFFLVFAAWLGVSTYSKNRDINRLMIELENREVDLSTTKKWLEKSFESYFKRKRQRMNGYGIYFETNKSYNYKVGEYRILINKINTLFNTKFVPKFSYANFNEQAQSIKDALRYNDD